MASYRVFITRPAQKQIEALPLGIRRLIVAKIGTLSSDPRPHGSQKLADDDKYRLRQGNYRIVYTVEDDIVTVTVVRVAHRSNVYR